MNWNFLRSAQWQDPLAEVVCRQVLSQGIGGQCRLFLRSTTTLLCSVTPEGVTTNIVDKDTLDVLWKRPDRSWVLLRVSFHQEGTVSLVFSLGELDVPFDAQQIHGEFFSLRRMIVFDEGRAFHGVDNWGEDTRHLARWLYWLGLDIEVLRAQLPWEISRTDEVAWNYARREAWRDFEANLPYYEQLHSFHVSKQVKQLSGRSQPFSVGKTDYFATP
jgi:hypothetical protein